MGQEAWQMIGRTPGYIVAVRPLRGGAITDFEITQRMIRLLFQRAGVNRLYRARVLICVPSAITHVEQRAVLEAARRAGAAQTFLIEQPMAAAIGAGLPIHEPMGNMVVDIGGGTTEVAVISLGGVVGARSRPGRLVRHRRRDPDLRAARVRHRDRRAHRRGDQARNRLRPSGRRRVQGRSARAATSCRACRRRSCSSPRRCGPRSRSRCGAICDAVIACLSQTPPELAQDLILNGVHLVGGGGMLRGLDRRIAEETDAAGASRRRAARVRRARRGPLPRELRHAQRDVHGPQRRALAVFGHSRFGLRNVVTNQVFRGLAHLPVAVFERGAQARFDLVAFERGEREHRAAPDRGLVVAPA